MVGMVVHVNSSVSRGGVIDSQQGGCNPGAMNKCIKGRGD
ncbi:hypothetical protein HMPREF1317_1957 [Schaalia georgiae F0490]|uniref:Uncharacterized protein n=1 Tax=Schaalia georgiae F0490 TaxID=1125717 RepID=J1HWK5_9ACTO|nr:hypothetical protein HMPREF1317_1957 [Schaalia georgiae F0490]